MQLTTVDRVKMWTPLGSQAAPSTQHDALLRSQISAVSRRIEAYLRRHVQIELRAEDYYVDPLSKRFFLKAAPIYTTTVIPGRQPNLTVVAAPTLAYEPLRDFSLGDVEDASMYYFRNEDGAAEFDFPINYTGFRNAGALRATYYGGLAYTLDQLVASSTSHVGTTLSVGASVTGSLSGATGTVLANVVDTSITIKVLSGEFQVGENFVSGASTAAFTAITTAGLPLCMAYPELVEACNMQVSWWFQKRENMGETSLSVEGATVSFEKTGTLIRGVTDTLEHLVRYGVSY